MMQAIEQEIIIPTDGKLPETFRQFFGRKARVILLVTQEIEEIEELPQSPLLLMELAGKIEAFKDIEDPVAWQRALRDEWTRDWER
jgi:hypothetical protein